MRAATTRAVRWHGPGDVRLDEVEAPPPGLGEVRVRPAFVGVCGSDLHEVLDGPHAIPVGRPHGLSGAEAPLVLGHEFSAVVESTGPGVTGLAAGDRVAVEPNYRCGICRACRSGRYHVCDQFGFAGLMGDGGMADLATLPAYMLHLLPDEVDLAEAALLEPAAVALHAVRRSGIGPGESAVVVGLGPVGLLVCALLRLRGVTEVIGVEPAAQRRHLASRLGAARVIDPGGVSPADTTENIRALSAGGADVAFEVVGHQATFDTALGSVRAGGTLLLLGLADELRIDGFATVNAEVTIRASVGYNACHRELIDLVASGALNLSAFTGDQVELAQAPQMLRDLAQGRRQGLKTLVRCAGAQDDDRAALVAQPVPSAVS
ncbi:alcohol dehydrogenase catalytic domain-containing protein [Nocardioides nanhaiensis]|uniref:2,3-butanediol dehydrogenase n=1 Tax=Nocardioides nanhaiensis TaxID=1476871 RepID=A0ABP8W9G7_9ACTN